MSSKLSKCTVKKFLTHDNGDRRYLVSINRLSVDVFKKPKNKLDYTILVKSYRNIKGVFVGKDPDNPEFKGNSILLKLSGMRYAYIGVDLYEFDTSDEIVAYYGMVGNSDVPYSVALGTENIYFMLDKVYVNRDVFERTTGWSDVYSEFYIRKLKGMKMRKSKVVFKRWS